MLVHLLARIWQQFASLNAAVCFVPAEATPKGHCPDCNYSTAQSDSKHAMLLSLHAQSKALSHDLPCLLLQLITMHWNVH